MERPSKSAGISLKDATFEELVTPIKASLLQLYKLKQIADEASFNGAAKLHCSVSCCSGDAESALSKANLTYHKERDRDPIDIILMLAFQFGYSKGWVMAEDQYRKFDEKFDSIAEFLKQMKEDE